ncbi:DNA adenine methylase [Nostoc sp. T09]|uniref:DNA adenine methylase n=1 Tax=Nostoc sp. T09 TaxID=1932621 RepID=UPI000A3875B6|nr:DNA adenine methylase [Nostoc sp. T09]
MASLQHLVQYQSSKRNLASDILKFLPNAVDRLVEPFAGTAAISIAASYQRISQKFWLNDLNQPLVKLLESKRCSRTWNSSRNFPRYRKQW